MEYVTNRRVLQTETPPTEMYVRESELTSLRATLDPIKEGQRASSAVIYGPSGAGKTHASKLIVSRLIDSIHESNERDSNRFEPTVDENSDDPEDITTTHIDCWDFSSSASILKKLLKGLGQGAQPSNTAGYELRDHLRNCLDYPYIVILDEADQIDDDQIFKTLHAIPEITLLLIINEYRPFLNSLEPSVESRLNGYQAIKFGKYNHDQLAEILTRRIEQGVHPGVVDETIVSLLVDVSENDARRAIDNLRKAIKKTEQRGQDSVTPAIVHEVVPETERELLNKTFSKFTRDQRILYKILVEDGGEMRMGSVYDEYCERVSEPKSKKTATRNLKKMTHYHAVDYRGKKSARRYWATTDALYPKE